MSEDQSRELNAETKLIPTASIKSFPYNPRIDFDDEKLNELSDAIIKSPTGMNDPLVIIPHPETRDAYIGIRGERRWRIHKRLERKKIRATIHPNLTENECFALALMDNLKPDRESKISCAWSGEPVSPLEEALAIEKWMKQTGLSQTKIADLLPTSAAWVSRRRALIDKTQLLPEIIQAINIPGSKRLPIRSALELKKLPLKQQKIFFNKVVDEGLSPDQSKRLVENYLTSNPQDQQDIIETPVEELGGISSSPSTISTSHDEKHRCRLFCSSCNSKVDIDWNSRTFHGLKEESS